MRVWTTMLLATCVAAGLGAALTWRIGGDLVRLVEPDVESRAVGDRANGRLEHGKRLSTLLPNVTPYSYLGASLGRTAVHSRVRDTLEGAWAELAATHPGVVWMYGETAWVGGGDLWPHKTHQHGLSVDHMVPVLDRDGQPVRLPCRAWNALCYRLHADHDGVFDGGQRTDFDALAALLDAIDRHARDHGLRVDLVIYAPDLQDDLGRAHGGRVARRLRMSRRPSWVRHDNHVHIDFRVVD